MRPDFSKINITSAFHKRSTAKSEIVNKAWKTPEGINVKGVFQKEDLQNMEHLDFGAGFPPFLRGPYGSMYTTRQIGRAHV